MKSKLFIHVSVLMLSALCTSAIAAGDEPYQKNRISDFLGQWTLDIKGGSVGWLELRQETYRLLRARAFPDDGKPTLKGVQLAIDELAKENPKAKNVTPQQVIDLSFLP